MKMDDIKPGQQKIKISRLFDVERDSEPGPRMKFENFHFRMNIEISIIDKIKLLFGAKLDLSVCGKVLVFLQQDGQYHYMKIGETVPKAVVWMNKEPQMLSPFSRFAISERRKQLTEQFNEGVQS